MKCLCCRFIAVATAMVLACGIGWPLVQLNASESAQDKAAAEAPKTKDSAKTKEEVTTKKSEAQDKPAAESSKAKGKPAAESSKVEDKPASKSSKAQDEAQTDKESKKAPGVIEYRLQWVRPGVIMEYSTSGDKEKQGEKGEQKEQPGRVYSRVVVIPEGGTAELKGESRADVRIYKIEADQKKPTEKDQGEAGAKTVDVTTIVVTKVEGQPAKITVTRGGQTWTVDENNLAPLPDDIRAWVEKHRELLQGIEHLRRVGPGLRMEQLKQKLQELSERAGRAVSGDAGDDQQSRLERVEKELERIRKELESVKQLSEEIRALRKALEEKKGSEEKKE
jgi:hypothetical protein